MRVASSRNKAGRRGGAGRGRDPQRSHVCNDRGRALDSLLEITAGGRREGTRHPILWERRPARAPSSPSAEQRRCDPRRLGERDQRALSHGAGAAGTQSTTALPFTVQSLRPLPAASPSLVLLCFLVPRVKAALARQHHPRAKGDFATNAYKANREPPTLARTGDPGEDRLWCCHCCPLF